MGDVTQRLADAGFSIPEPPNAIGMYVPATRTDTLVFTSGQLPTVNGELLAKGCVGETVAEIEAFSCAETCALNALAAAATVCDLDDVVRVLKLVGYVSSASGFRSQAAVVNGASGVVVAAFGEAGRHAREAVGVARLPMDAPVEVSIVLQVGR